MTTLAKNLKDSNGNTILPKTRASWVYCNDNTTVETKLNNIPTIDPSSIIYSCTYSKTGTIHTLSCNNFPSTTIVHVSFIPTSNYVSGDTFKINNVAYTPKMVNNDDPPNDFFTANTVVSMDVNLSTHICFFKSGGASGPPKEPTDEASSYQIIQAFTSDNVWTVPETNWYRMIAIAKSGNGGGGGNCAPSHGGAMGGMGAGGNAGGISCSTALIEKVHKFQLQLIQH